jgi:hypothetical protein
LTTRQSNSQNNIPYLGKALITRTKTRGQDAEHNLKHKVINKNQLFTFKGILIEALKNLILTTN